MKKTIRIALAIMIMMAANHASAQNKAFEKKEIADRSLQDMIYIFQHGDTGHILNCHVDTFRAAVRECFNGNKEKWLRNPKNAWMAKKPVLSDSQIVWIMRHSQEKDVAFKKGQMHITRVTPTGSYNFFYRGPYGKKVLTAAGDSVVVDSIETMFTYDEGDAEAGWMFRGCKNSAIDKRPSATEPTTSVTPGKGVFTMTASVTNTQAPDVATEVVKGPNPSDNATAGAGKDVVVKTDSAASSPTVGAPRPGASSPAPANSGSPPATGADNNNLVFFPKTSGVVMYQQMTEFLSRNPDLKIVGTMQADDGCLVAFDKK